MISSNNINIKLNTSYKKIKSKIKPKLLTIYTGCPDLYFNYKYGKLDWRSLKFSFKTYNQKFKQNCVQYNYPNDYKYTRTVEIKHVTKQKSKYTVISKEYPLSAGDPYYPINNERNNKIFKKYLKLIKLEEKINVFFEGRLANYKYLNTDQVIEKALKLHKKIQMKVLKNANK